MLFRFNYFTARQTDYFLYRFNTLLKNKKQFDKKTRVIIIGDAENGGDEVGDDYLFEVKEKCKCIYWLNPVKEEKWDKNFNNYKIYCKEVYECNNLKQLENIMKNII